MSLHDRFVTVVEVGPRDGLQNEKQQVPAAAKTEFLNGLSKSGLRIIEATAFVSPKAIPQLADAETVLSTMKKEPGVRYPVLVPNEKGLERALKCGVTDIALFTAASATFNKRNINATIEESFERFQPVFKTAKAMGLWVRGYVSCAFGCPYEGFVDPEKTVAITARLLSEGCAQVSIGDTIGVAVPMQVSELLCRLAEADIPLDQLAFHFHDTRGTALANVWEALRGGVRIFDSAAGGLGGCPYAAGASGNLATEDLLYLLHASGFETGADLTRVFSASRTLAAVLQRGFPSRVWQALASGAQWPPEPLHGKAHESKGI